MTKAEATDILVQRVGWRNDNTVTGLSLSPTNQISNSGLFFNDFNPAITLANIRDSQPIVNISEANFQAYLETIKRTAVSQVLSDVYEKDYINDNLLTLYPSGFDYIIQMKLLINVGNLIMFSVRSNRIQRLTEQFVAKLHYDIFREAPNKFAIRGANYRSAMGVSTAYNYELDSVQRRFGQTRNMLKTVTKGQVCLTHEQYKD